MSRSNEAMDSATKTAAIDPHDRHQQRPSTREKESSNCAAIAKAESAPPVGQQESEKEARLQSWAVTVERDGDQVVTLGHNHLSGRDLDALDKEAIRTAAQHLLSFLGESAPSVGQASEAVNTERLSDMNNAPFSKLPWSVDSTERCDNYINDADDTVVGQCISLMDARYVVSAVNDYAQAYGYLLRLVQRCAARCEPLPDLLGLATQIDNYIAGLNAPPVGQQESERMLALARKWRLQDEPNDDVRDAIQQCADELEVSIRKSASSVAAAPALDTAASLIYDIRMARTREEVWAVVQDTERLALAASEVSVAQHPLPRSPRAGEDQQL